MNEKTAFFSAIAVAVTTALFAAGIISGCDTLSFLVCIVLSWAYILLACSLAAQAAPERKAAAYGGIAFAVVYAVFVCLVYFTQLTTVASQNASADVLQVLSYQSLGSLMFNLDLFGYGMMALSTLLIGMTMRPANKTDKWLKALLMIHGIFAPACVLMPMLNVFNADMAGGDFIGSAVLLFWCAYFIPVGILSALHFKKPAQSV